MADQETDKVDETVRQVVEEYEDNISEVGILLQPKLDDVVHDKLVQEGDELMKKAFECYKKASVNR